MRNNNFQVDIADSNYSSNENLNTNFNFGYDVNIQKNSYGISKITKSSDSLMSSTSEKKKFDKTTMNYNEKFESLSIESFKDINKIKKKENKLKQDADDDSEFSTPISIANSGLPPKRSSVISDDKKTLDSKTNKRSSESCPAPDYRQHNERTNIYKAKLKTPKRKFVSTEKVNETANQVITAQRLKNNDLQNQIVQLTNEVESLREDNRTLKRVHIREEIALKKLETHETDIGRMVKNYSEEINSLKQTIRKLNTETKRLNAALIEKEDELRIFKKKNDKLKAILNDKNLIESNELKTKLDVCERELNNQNQRCENLEYKLELNEKNHKHEVGIELKRQKDMQKQIKMLNDEITELRVRLEERERAIDAGNIYSRATRDTNNGSIKLNINPEIHNSFGEKRKENFMNRKIKEDDDSKQNSYREDRNNPIQQNLEVVNYTEKRLHENLKERENPIVKEVILNKSQIEEPKQHDKPLGLLQLTQSFGKIEQKQNQEKEKNAENKVKVKTIEEKHLLTEHHKINVKLDVDKSPSKHEHSKAALDALEELERKKRWTEKKVDDEEDVKQKKDDLLAKLFSNDSSTNSTMAHKQISQQTKVQENQQKTFKLFDDRKLSSDENFNTFSEKDSDKKLLLGKLFGNMDRSTPNMNDNLSNDSNSPNKNDFFTLNSNYNALKRQQREQNNIFPAKQINQSSHHYIEDIEELSL